MPKSASPCNAILKIALIISLGGTLGAQLPPGWSHQEALGAGQKGAWYGSGVWAADKHSAPATFVDSLGLGNAMTGQGVHLEGGWTHGPLEVAGQVAAWRASPGISRIILQRFHVAYTSARGWRTALEQEPMVWGFGLNGGYVLGEAARPFPKFRLDSPLAPVRFLGIPLGSWKGSIFLGQIEGQKVIGESSQDPSYRRRAIAAMGDPQRPYLSGIRLESKLGDNTELYLNYINLFGGSSQGRSLSEGYSARDWMVAFFGLKDSIAEGGQDFNGPPGSFDPIAPTVKSASTSDVGVRVRLSPLESWLGAEDVRIYVSRGAKAVNTRAQILFHRPGYAFSQDLQRDFKSLVQSPLHPWTQRARYVLPTTPVPNDAVGILIRWVGWRVGAEYLDTANTVMNPDNPGQTNHRTFEHEIYQSGFYQEGDPLGNATAGEARTVTLRAERDWNPRWTTRTWLFWGDRPFREAYIAGNQPFSNALANWTEDHPGALPARNRFLGLQQILEWRPDAVFSLRTGASVMHQNAFLNVMGEGRTGFRWFINLSWIWSRN